MSRPFLLFGLGLFLLACAALEQLPDGTQERLDRARSLLDDWHGDRALLEAARTELDAILVQDPELAPAHREYARYYLMAGYRKNFEVDPDALQAAEKSLTTALALDPAYAEAYVLAGHLYLLQGRNSDAKAALQMAESLGSQDPWLHLNWAAIHMVERNPEDALARYRQVAESGTTNRNAMEGALDGLVSYYRGKNLDGDADRAYRQLIAYSPDVAWHYGNYAGFLLCRLNHFDAAIEQYRIALDKMSYGLARRGLAAALYRKWAWHTNEDELDLTTGLLEEARTLWEGGPVEVFEEHCKAGNPALEQVRLAVRLTETRQRAQSEKAD